MKSPEILTQMQEVFDRIFFTKVVVTESLSAADVEEWDSLTHLSLVVALEKKFQVRFQTGEVEKTKNIGEFVDLLSRKMGNA